MLKFQVTVYSFRKPAVLNPEEGPVLHGLHDLGFKIVSKVTIGRCFILTIEAANETDAKEQATAMCNKFLVNLVVEEFKVVEVKQLSA